MRFSKAVVKYRIPILILTVILMIPSVIGMINTRVNYDMLTYLPSDMETVVGQNELLKDFDKGAFTFLIFEDKQSFTVCLVHTESLRIGWRAVVDFTLFQNIVLALLIKEGKLHTNGQCHFTFIHKFKKFGNKVC